MKAGDFVLLQFGHNDQSEITMDRGTLSRARQRDRDGVQRSRRIACDGRDVRRVRPPVRRRRAREGRDRGLLHPGAAELVARRWPVQQRDGRAQRAGAARSGKELDVPVIDLNQSLSATYAQMGRRAVSSQWYTVGDNTHTNAAGAGVNAAAVADGIKGLATVGLRPSRSRSPCRARRARCRRPRAYGTGSPRSRSAGRTTPRATA